MRMRARKHEFVKKYFWEPRNNGRKIIYLCPFYYFLLLDLFGNVPIVGDDDDVRKDIFLIGRAFA